jgi:hypothetical protein
MRLRHTLAATAVVVTLPILAACGVTSTSADAGSTASPSASSSTASPSASASTDSSGSTSATTTNASEAQLVALVQEAYGEAQLGLHRGHQPIQSVLTAVLTISHDELHVRMEQQGQNLAAVATDLGIDPQTLVDALVADGGTAVQSALDSGAIDQQQADAYLAALEEAFTWRINWDGSEATPTFSGIAA